MSSSSNRGSSRWTVFHFGHKKIREEEEKRAKIAKNMWTCSKPISDSWTVTLNEFQFTLQIYWYFFTYAGAVGIRGPVQAQSNILNFEVYPVSIHPYCITSWHVRNIYNLWWVNHKDFSNSNKIQFEKKNDCTKVVLNQERKKRNW